MQIKKLSTLAIGVLMAMAVTLPISALATQTPDVEYTGGTGDAITHLNLIATDENLANNNTTAWNKENGKVQVPVAITYVAQADGTVLGPQGGTIAENKASITNYSVFPVHVTNIAVTAGQNVTIDTTTPTQADHIQLFVQPGNGTLDQFGYYTVSGGSRPAVPVDWNIASGAGQANGTSLALNSLGGSIGGFQNIDPSTTTEIGQVSWTITAGTHELGDLTLGERAHGSAAVSASSTGIDDTPLYVGDTAYVFVSPDEGYDVAGVQITSTGGQNINATKLTTPSVGGQNVSAAAIENDDMSAGELASADVFSFVVPSGELSVNVMFAQASYALTTPTAQGGTVALKADPSDVDGISQAGYGDTVYVITTPDTGYRLASIAVTGEGSSNPVVVTVDGNTARFTMPAEAVSASAVFEAIGYSLTKSPADNGSFALSSSPSGTLEIATATYGQAVYIIASPAQNYEIASVSVNGSAIEPSGGAYSFPMPAGDAEVAVAFRGVASTLAKANADNGSFVVGRTADAAADATDVRYNDVLYVIPTPDANYEVASVTVNGTPIAAEQGAYRFTAPANSTTVAVSFRGVAATVAKSPTSNGSFVVGRTAAAAADATDTRYNDILYIVPTPDANYEVKSVTVNGSPISASGGSYSFDLPASGATVAVSFQGVAATVSKSPTSNGSFVVGRTADAAADATDTRYNDTLYIVPSPAVNYEVASVTVNGAPLVVSGGSYSFNLPAGNSTVAVSFAGTPATITKSQTSHGSFVVGRTADAATDATDTRYNDTLYIVPTPDANYEVDSVTVNGSPISASGGSYSFDLPANGATIAVSFRGVSATVTKSTTSNGSFIVGNSSSATSDAANTRYNDTLYVIPSPHTGYQVSSITVNGTPIAASGGSYSFSLPASGATVAVSFSPIIYSVLKDTAQNGSFIVDDAATPVADITQAPYASTVYVSVVPATGYQIDQVKATGLTSGQATSIAISNGKGSFTMPAEAVRVSATFTKVNYSIMRATTTNGSFVVGDSAVSITNLATAQYGDTVYVNGAPNTGYQVSQIKVTGGTSGTITNLTVSNNKSSFTMPAEAVTVSVTFAKVNYSLTPSSTSNGSFVLSSASRGTPTITTAQYGDTVYVKTTPNTGYKVSSVTTSPSTTVTTNTANSVYSFTMPASAVTVSVTFTKENYSLTKATTSNGSFVLSSASSGTPTITTAQYGDTVYIVAAPAEGYAVNTMTVTPVSGSGSVTVARDSGSNVGHFTMPAAAVNVSVTFKEPEFLDVFPLATIRDDSAAIRSSSTPADEKTALINKYLPYAQAGELVTVTLADGTATPARLVDVNASKGLVFMFVFPLDTKVKMNGSGTSSGAWNASALRTNLNSGELYTTYLQGMTIDGTAATPIKVSNNSGDYNGGTYQNISTDTNGNGPADDGDMFWLASAKEIYGASGSYYAGVTSVEQGSQFAYYANLGVSTSNNCRVVGNGSYCWLRSAYENITFLFVDDYGSPSSRSANSACWVLPCFCL